MKDVVKKLVHMFLVIRPYSVIDIVLLGILGNVLVKRTLVVGPTLLLDMFFAFTWWTTALLFVEYRKNRRIDAKIVLFFAVFLMAITFYRNISAIIFILLDILLLYWYSLKSKNQIFAITSPIARGLLSLTLFLMIVTFHDGLNILFISSNWHLLMTITLIIIARNLEGDVRDLNVDKYSLAIKLGRKKSRQLIIFLIALVSLLIFNPTVLPLLLLGFIMLFNLERSSFHRIFVLTTMFFIAMYILYIVGDSLLILLLLFVGILFNFTYNSVPRTQSLVKKNLKSPYGGLREGFLQSDVED